MSRAGVGKLSLGKGLENKYFRPKRWNTRFYVLHWGSNLLFLSPKSIARISFPPQSFKKTFFSLQIIKSRQRAVFGPKAIVCPLLAQSIALYNFLWWWKSFVCIVPNKWLLSIWNVATVTGKLNFKLDLILITLRQPFKSFYEFKERA